jgi:hypothetical protein
VRALVSLLVAVILSCGCLVSGFGRRRVPCDLRGEFVDAKGAPVMAAGISIMLVLRVEAAIPGRPTCKELLNGTSVGGDERVDDIEGNSFRIVELVGPLPDEPVVLFAAPQCDRSPLVFDPIPFTVNAGTGECRADFGKIVVTDTRK